MKTTIKELKDELNKYDDSYIVQLYLMDPKGHEVIYDINGVFPLRMQPDETLPVNMQKDEVRLFISTLMPPNP